MKKYLIVILFLLISSFLFSQHENIERHFSSYKLNTIVYPDYTYYDDTLTDFFFLYMPQQKYSLNYLGLPNLGSAFYPSIYSERRNCEYWFLDNYFPYIQSHDEIVYFDAKKPFSLFKFAGGGGGQELVKFLHTQNISPTFNFAFNYDIINSDGYYQYSKSKINAISLATAYTKRKYQSHFNFIFNKINNLENGGLKDLNKYFHSNYSAGTYSTNLSQAQNTVSQLGFQYNHEFRFGSYSIDTIVASKDTSINKNFQTRFSIVHDIKADKYHRIYQDVPSSFYTNTFFDTRNTFDSTSFRTLNNKVLLNYSFKTGEKIENLQMFAGLKSHLYNYTLDSSISHTHFSNFLVGNLILKTESSNLNLDVEYCFMGKDVNGFEFFGDYNLDIGSFKTWNINFDFSNLNPSEFIDMYSSNHYIWDADRLKISNLSANTAVNFEKYKFSIGINSNLLKNYIIFNTESMPAQVASANFVGDVWLSKQFDFGKFHWFSKLSYQYIKDKKYLPLPEYIAYSSIYFKSPLFKKAMILQLGFDVKYFSKAYLYAYNPALGVFYLQTERKYGNYPNAAFNLSVLVKRLRGFVRISNFNSFIMARNYFVSHNMPDNPFSFNFGISWEFYD